MRLRRVLAAPALALLSLTIAAGPAVAGKPGTWTKLDSGARTDVAAEPTLARSSNGTLHVAFPQHGSTSYSTVHVPVSTAGAKGTASTVVSGWSSMTFDPVLELDRTRGYDLYLPALAGTSGPLANGNLVDAYSQNATSWAIMGGATTPLYYSAQGASLDEGLDVATLSSGETVSAYTTGSNTIHVLVDHSTDYAVADTLTITRSPASVQVLDPALVTSGSTVRLVWFQWGSGTDGVYTAQVYPVPSSVTVTKAPGSSTKYDGKQQAVSPDTPGRTPLVAPAGGGVYTAYCVGYPSCAHIALWRVGATKAVTVPGSKNAMHVALSPGPGGRLWLSWYDYSSGGHIKAVRTNAAATRFGPVRTIALPKGNSPYALQVDGSRTVVAAPADIVVNTGASTSAPGSKGVFHTQVLAGLTLKAAPTSWRHTTAKRVVFTVADAGAAVKGAVVKAAGRKCTTSTHGTCALTFPKTRAKGTFKATVTKSGYAGASLTLKRT